MSRASFRRSRKATPTVEALESIISLSKTTITQGAVTSQGNAAVVTLNESNTKGKLIIDGVCNVVQYNGALISQSANTSGSGSSTTQVGVATQSNSAVVYIDASNHRGKLVIKDSGNVIQENLAQVDQSANTDGTDGSATQVAIDLQTNSASVAIIGLSTCKGKVEIKNSANVIQYNDADVSQVAAVTGATSTTAQEAILAQSNGATVIIDVSNCRGKIVIKGSCNVYQYNGASVSQTAS